MNYRAYLQTDHWRELSAAKIEDVNHRCERCRRRSQLEPHHKHYRTLGHERLSDLEVLCRDCHQRHHDAEIAAKVTTPLPSRRACPRESLKQRAATQGALVAKLQRDFETAARLHQNHRGETIYRELKLQATALKRIQRALRKS